MKIFLSIMKRDLLLAYREWFELCYPIIFFVLTVTLFPLAVSPDSQLLHTIAPGIIWVAALLAALLGLEKLFKADFLDGSLEQFLVNPYPLPLVVLAKTMTHWLLTGLPLICVCPLLALLLHLSGQELNTLILTILLGTPTLSFIGAIGMALTVSLRGSGVLLALLLIPLYIPVLIFAAGAQLFFLSALLVLGVTLAPFATAAAIRVSME